MSITEETMAKMPLEEKNHLLNIYNEKKFRGWYRYEFYETNEGVDYKFTVARFRLPPAMPVYSEVIRQFSDAERLIGIHRMLIGKDLKDEVKDWNKLDEYVKSLTDAQVQEMLERVKDIVTIDCNKIPYLIIRTVANEDKTEYIKDTIARYIADKPDYLGTYIDVLNSRITIDEAVKKSEGIIYNEFLEIGLGKTS